MRMSDEEALRFWILEFRFSGRRSYQVASDPAADQAEGNDGQLVKLVRRGLGQQPNCVRQNGAGHKHADCHQPHKRGYDPERHNTCSGTSYSPCFWLRI